jgi:hypothetical protein
MGETFFQYPDALHELIRARACPALSGMVTRCAEIALACVHLPIFFSFPGGRCLLLIKPMKSF